ncbi:tetratricopeptide repeat protein [Dethiobacter alkaliphilus]|uniref:Tetratricopeptide TPR_2 repeat protein n=1 Tax=Dethiobacter alkaliphilus AHT 1 TaxID=555088 RepID=C0GGN7_DETAL|nr:DUF4352 domain-containing protein [Dethiobacter alkaliphilus]EEG77478.1 Tetratricopeptide TPR_2 repeat protein [Dethiobacter alkaliphilus AHT 1]
MLKRPFTHLIITVCLALATVYLYHFGVSLYEQQKTINELTESGIEYMSEQDYGKAASAFSRALALNPNDDYIREQYNIAYNIANELALSNTYFISGMYALDEDELIAAWDWFNKVVPRDDNYELAQQKIEQLVEGVAEEYLQIARDHFSNKSYIQAYSYLTESISINPDLVAATNLLPKYEQKKEEFLEQREIEQEKQLQAQREKQAQKQKEEELELMRRYENDTGAIKVAVTNVEKTDSFDYFTAAENSWFIKIYVNTRNYGTQGEQITHRDFSLSTPDGFLVMPIEPTEISYRNYKNTRLQPETYSGGWLLFHIPKADNYTLYFDNNSSRATKRVLF